MTTPRGCTCHPDDNPPRPCPQRYALSECRAAAAEAPPLVVPYTNWRGEHGERTITPCSIWFGSTEWHPESQWFIRAYDHDKNAYRDFALSGFGASATPLVDEALRKAVARFELERLKAAPRPDPSQEESPNA